MVEIEVYSYTVLASILGMLVVFGFLWFLSLLMSVLVKVFDDKNPESGKAAVVTGSVGTEDDWVFAAAAVFLSKEELECTISATSWGPVTGEKNDPWLHNPRLAHKRTGV